MAGAVVGVCVWAAQGTGSAVLFVRGGGRGHGMAVACVAALGGAAASVAGAGAGGAYCWLGERKARCCSWGEGDVDSGVRVIALRSGRGGSGAWGGYGGASGSRSGES